MKRGIEEKAKTRLEISMSDEPMSSKWVSLEENQKLVQENITATFNLHAKEAELKILEDKVKAFTDYLCEPSALINAPVHWVKDRTPFEIYRKFEEIFGVKIASSKHGETT